MNHFAKKSLGQNFLLDLTVVEKIIEAAELRKTDTVVEVGPGKGILTASLLDRCGKVIAVELDKDLLPYLKIDFGSHKHFELLHLDALNYQPPEHYKIVANLPYYITSPLLNHFLYDQFVGGNPPELLVIMVQKEVAEKLVAKDGKHSILSLQVHLFGEPELVCEVPRKAFKPSPKVDSAVVKIRVHTKPKINVDLKKLFWFFKICFAQKRKKLTNNLGGMFKLSTTELRTILNDLGISEDVRAEDLNLSEWEKLYERFCK